MRESYIALISAIAGCAVANLAPFPLLQAVGHFCVSVCMFVYIHIRVHCNWQVVCQNSSPVVDVFPVSRLVLKMLRTLLCITISLVCHGKKNFVCEQIDTEGKSFMHGY